MALISVKKIEYLEAKLENYLDLVNNREIIDQIVKGYRFETPATIFKLYNKDAKKIEQFIEELSEFFYAGTVYLDPKLKKPTFSGFILLSRFINLFDVVIYYYSNKWDDKLDNLADLSCILSGGSLKDISGHISQERIEALVKIIDSYSNLFDDYYARSHIIRAFTADKPVTTIDIYDQNIKAVSRFIEQLEAFFLVGKVNSNPEIQQSIFSGDIIISRFKNPFDIIMKYATKGFGLREWFADLSGLFVRGEVAKGVALYCQKDHMKEFDLVK